MLFVREQRVGRQPQFLRALDLAVPVRALDQAHHETQAVAARDRRHLVDQRQRSRLVGLHRQAETLPLRAGGGDALGDGFEDVQRQLQPVDLLGVDGQVQVGRGGAFDQRPDTRQQRLEDTLALRVLVAREQRRELDRDAVALHRRARTARRGVGRDRVDRVQITRLVALGVGFGARALAQHVVAEAQHGLQLALRRGFLHRFVDVAAEHELAPQQLERPHGGGDDGARPQALQQAGGLLGVGQETFGQRDRACRQAGQHLVRAFVAAGLEVGAAELVGGQRNRGLGVGHTQQRFGQAHQRQAFGAGDRVLAQQRLHRPERGRIGAHRLDPGAGAVDDGVPVEPALQRSERGGDGLGLGAVRKGQALARRRDGHGRAPGDGRAQCETCRAASDSVMSRLDRESHGWTTA